MLPIRLHNTLSRAIETLEPVTPGRVSIYTCGSTVYKYAHIGNLRTYLFGDLLHRTLEYLGYEVLYVKNITDVGHMRDDQLDSVSGPDKIELAAEVEGKTPAEIADFYTHAWFEDEALINILPADVTPKATDHISEMIDLTGALLEKGLAYEVDGTIYYDVSEFPGYGQLSGQKVEETHAGHRVEVESDKRDPADFALWKHAHEHRSMRWPSPWGDGFPGWHIECSAMSLKHLGERFDVHTGGIDLKFPHHEDEIAQSEGAVGHEVISTWLHGGFLRLKEQKMAKSSGNIIRIGDLEALKIDPLSFRYLTFETRYRKEMDFSEDALRAADTAVKRLRQRMAEWGGPAERLSSVAKTFDERFRDAVGDDLDMPRALVILNELASSQAVPDPEKYSLVSSWDQVLGLDAERDARAGWQPSDEVAALVAERDTARASKDFATADRVRDRLQELGLEVMDTPEGTRVRPRI